VLWCEEQRMKDPEFKKFIAALRPIVNLEAPLKNYLKRAPRAAKHWTAQAKDSRWSGQEVSGFKLSVATLGKLTKDAKTVLKDWEKITMTANPKGLANYATGKEFRDKVLAKQLKSFESWDTDCEVFMRAMTNLAKPAHAIAVADAAAAKALKPDAKPHPVVSDPGQAADQIATWEAVTSYRHYFNQLTTGLAKLG
jgi:hypothetical protein